MRVLDCRRTESCRAAPILLTFWKFVCFLTETASFTFGFQEAEDVVFADGALDVTNDATVGVIHEFDTNLSDTTTGAGTAEDLDNASKLNRLLGSFLQCNWIQLLRWFTQNTSFFEVIRRHPSIIHKSIRNHPNMLLHTVAVVCVGLYVPLSLIPEKGRVNGSQSNAIFVGLLVLPPHSVEISTSDNYSSSSSSHLLPSIIDNHISSSFFSNILTTAAALQNPVQQWMIINSMNFIQFTVFRDYFARCIHAFPFSVSMVANHLYRRSKAL